MIKDVKLIKEQNTSKESKSKFTMFFLFILLFSVNSNVIAETWELEIPIENVTPAEVVLPESPLDDRCLSDADCIWCGESCIRSSPNIICITITPPEDYECKCIGGQCTAVLIATPTPKKGVISVLSSPSGANVYLNGVYKGITPIILNIPVGTYSVRLTKSGYEDETKSVYVSAGETKQISLVLKSAFSTPDEKIVIPEPPKIPIYTYSIILLFILLIAAVIGITKRKKSRTTEEIIKTDKKMPTKLHPTTFPSELQEFYTDVEAIGKGGFARVFRAKRNGKKVAVKIPVALDSATGKSFLKEIENWVKLDHPNIVKVYDYNILPIPYFEMELCDQSLADLPKPLKEKAAWLIFNICEGLKYAHSRGIIHRDLKPQNIMLKDGIPKITDWGLSKILAESKSTLQAFSPLYAAPEQISKKFGKPDKKTDIWQLGVIFYELVTGKLPFEGKDITEIGFAIVNENPKPPSEINPEAKDVEQIIMKCLEKDKNKRYQSAEELQKDLAIYLGLEYKESLKESISVKDVKKSAYYCGELMLINLRVGDLVQAYKYASDLLKYAKQMRKEIEEFCKELEYRIDNKIGISEELIKKADIIVYKLLNYKGGLNED